jgi:hypothetical protein
MMNHWKICTKLSTSIPAMYFMGKFIKQRGQSDNENYHNENHYKLQFLVESNSEENEVSVESVEKNNHPHNENHYKLQFLVESNSEENEVSANFLERNNHGFEVVELSGESHVES